MTKLYVGTKVVEAYPKRNGDMEGYVIRYPNPDNAYYEAWCPKIVFEDTYRLLRDYEFNLIEHRE